MTGMEILLKESKGLWIQENWDSVEALSNASLFFCVFSSFFSVRLAKVKIYLFYSIGCHFTFKNTVKSAIFTFRSLEVNVFPFRQVGKLKKRKFPLCMPLQWIFFLCCQEEIFKNQLCWHHCNIKPFLSYFSKSVLWFIPVAQLQQILLTWNLLRKMVAIHFKQETRWTLTDIFSSDQLIRWWHWWRAVSPSKERWGNHIILWY